MSCEISYIIIKYLPCINSFICYNLILMPIYDEQGGIRGFISGFSMYETSFKTMKKFSTLNIGRCKTVLKINLIVIGLN